MGERLPIIYVRGFGGGQRGIDKLVDDPFYGFNTGSTHIRVGAAGEPRFHQYEGPLLRLMNEDGYHLEVGGNQQQRLLDASDEELEPDSVWVYRFYDKSAGTFGLDPQPYRIGEAARGLADFIDLVRTKTRGHPRVNLVAHSMGGLICRAALQRELADPTDAVSKLCTMGTPHGGIDPELGGNIGDWFLETFGPQGSDVFAPAVMAGYLLPDGHLDDGDPPKGWDPREMVGPFPAERVLSVVGTNSRDYDVALGLSSLAMGNQSDGLVAIRNAYVKGSPRAFVHRSHSGRYGVVNSEESYQNLKRFLLGTLRIRIELDGLDEHRLTTDRVWQTDVHLAIRELPVLVHEQTAAHQCPVDLREQAADESTPLSPVPLITLFLAPGHKAVCRYALNLRVASLKQERGWFGFRDHLEQIGDWDDTMLVDLAVEPLGAPRAGDVTGGTYAWNSSLPGRIAETELMPETMEWSGSADAGWTGSVALPQTARAILGDQARLSFSADLWD